MSISGKMAKDEMEIYTDYEIAFPPIQPNDLRISVLQVRIAELETAIKEALN